MIGLWAGKGVFLLGKPDGENLPVFVIMAGGCGERLWPRSRGQCPKQLLNLIGERSLLQQSVERIRSLTDDDRIYVVTNIDYAEQVREQLLMLPKENILVEPEGRNTAPCVGLAALYIQNRFPEEDPVAVFLPSDNLVHNPKEMRNAILAGVRYTQQADTGVIFGMWPTRPETGYGYIRLGEKLGERDGTVFHEVKSFKEKPDGITALKYLESKEFLWNAGIFVWKVNKLWKEIKTYLPELALGLEKLRPCLGTEAEFVKLAEIYPTLPSISVDYGILEKSRDLAVVPTDFGWDDLGNWSSLGRYFPQDRDGNMVRGCFTGVETKNCIVDSPQKMVAALGVSELIIVETDDVLLVCSKEKAQEVRKIVEKLRGEKREELL
jgi:mannose-1-phosphate guanylyltransferase